MRSCENTCPGSLQALCGKANGAACHAGDCQWLLAGCLARASQASTQAPAPLVAAAHMMSSNPVAVGHCQSRQALLGHCPNPVAFELAVHRACVLWATLISASADMLPLRHAVLCHTRCSGWREPSRLRWTHLSMSGVSPTGCWHSSALPSTSVWGVTASQLGHCNNDAL